MRGRLITEKKDEAVSKGIDAAMSNKSKLEIGDWAWVYDDHSTVTGGGKHVLKTNEGSSALKFVAALVSKLANCWTCPYKELFVGPGKTADGREVGPKSLLLEKTSPVEELMRAGIHRCKKCFNSYDGVTPPSFFHGP